MKKFVDFVKKPVVWVTTTIVCVVGVVTGILVKFKDKIFG